MASMAAMAESSTLSTAIDATLAVTFVSTEHGRMQRRQRGIDKKDLQAARKYGNCYPNLWSHKKHLTVQYHYNGIVYVVDEVTDEEVTCWAHPIKLDRVPTTSAMLLAHDEAKLKLQNDTNAWTSNTVLLVDTSGSMRKSDVWGVTNRLQSVWLSVALDFLAHRLESGAAGPMDVVSVVTLEKEPQVVVKEEPSTWILYNRLVNIYKRSEIRPTGHGPFLPSLEKAEALLTSNSNAACVAALCLLSDGKPSDNSVMRGYSSEACEELILKKVAYLAKQFGRRLTFTAIGIGDKEEFSTLEKMVETAKDYGTIAEFRLPSMTSAAIGDVFTSLSSSLTRTQTEMTSLDTMKQQRVRHFLRESKKKASKAITVVSEDEFDIYALNQIKRTTYREWFEGRKRKSSFECASLQHPDARYVAFCKEPLGEGAERFAFRFLELASDARTIVGVPMVPKESRLVLDERGIDDENARKEFVKIFCSTQQRLPDDLLMNSTRSLTRHIV